MAEILTEVQGQVPVRVKGQTSCIYHHGKLLDLFCEKCKEISCVDCSTSTHNGHDFSALSNISAKKKKNLQKIIARRVTKDIPSMKNSIKSIEANIATTNSTFAAIGTEIIKQRDKLKRKIDSLADQTLAVYEKLKSENMTLLTDCKEEHERRHAVLMKEIREARTLIRSGDDISVYDNDAVMASLVGLPARPTLNTATFTPNLVPLDHLKCAFGTVTKGNNNSNSSVSKTSEESRDKVEVSEVPNDKVPVSEKQGSGEPKVIISQAEQPHRTSDKEHVNSSTKLPSSVNHGFVPSRQSEASGNFQVTGATESGEMLFQKMTDHEPKHIKIEKLMSILGEMRNGDIWVGDIERRTFLRIGRTGTIKDIIPQRRQVTDSCFSTQNQELWFCSQDDNSIIEVTSAPTIPRFYTEESPLCIYVTMDGQIIVGMPKQITKFNTDGQVILTTKPSLLSMFWRQIVCVPRFIAECPRTKNIAVIDGMTHNILVLDKTLNELVRYPGRKHDHLKPVMIDRFTPTRITYDLDGCMFIEDIGNNCMHLIGGRGEFYGLLVNRK
ncbi:uncharacterized protein LOC117316722 [Pecten maximus]|uniref:uncharacterized protein LOC117316722 n=1 Tax=Pecten maximus TaxID=6579 RepID=UPI0014588BAF|nr:uncharacterized protein LOC117316722 [Pecten maximus]